MRLFLIENITGHEFDMHDSDDVDQLVEFAKENCSRAINEFVKTGNYLYRGMDNIDEDSAYVAKTKEKRDALGYSIRGNVRVSFNDWLEKAGHVRRDSHVAFATSGLPENYEGVSVESWFYVIPVGDYQYTYIDHDTATDFNFTKPISRTLGKLSEVETYAKYLAETHQEAIQSWEFAKKRPDWKVSKNMQSLVNEFFDFSDRIESFGEDVLSLFKSGIFEGNKLQTLNSMVEKKHAEATSWKEAFAKKTEREVENSDRDEKTREMVSFLLNLVFDVTYNLRHMDEDMTEELIEGIEETQSMFVSNKIGSNFKNKEVFIGCKQYLLIPYDETGNDVINRLKK